MPVEGASVLLVSDNEPLATLTARVLESRGLRVERTDTADGVLELIDDQAPPFAATVVDLVGGTTEALKLLDQIRSHEDPTISGLRVVITTGVDENRLFSWQSGADGFLVRPYHVDELLELLEGALGRTDEERTAFRKDQTQRAIEQHQQH